MMSVYIDLSLHCARDRFFVERGELLEAFVADLADELMEMESVREMHLIQHGWEASQGLIRRFVSIIDGGPIASFIPARDHHQIMSFLASQGEPGSEGGILYVNPFQGIVTKQRLLTMPINPAPGVIHVSAHKAPVNIHPLWVTPVAEERVKRDSFVLRVSEMQRSLRDDADLMEKIQKDTHSTIAGSQYLKDVYLLDGAMVSVDRMSLTTSEKTALPVVAEPYGQSLSEEMDLPWFYQIPIFSMDRDTKVFSRSL